MDPQRITTDEEKRAISRNLLKALEDHEEVDEVPTTFQKLLHMRAMCGKFDRSVLEFLKTTTAGPPAEERNGEVWEAISMQVNMSWHECLDDFIRLRDSVNVFAEDSSEE